MKLLKFLVGKVVVVEVMLIILNVACMYFGISLPILNAFLGFLTPIAVIAFILYIIFSLLDSKIVQTALGIVLGGIILYYLFKYILV